MVSRVRSVYACSIVAESCLLSIDLLLQRRACSKCAGRHGPITVTTCGFCVAARLLFGCCGRSVHNRSLLARAQHRRILDGCIKTVHTAALMAERQLVDR